MLPTRSTIEVEGNLNGEKVTMGFDANSIGHLMGVLTDLYSDKVMAVVREYSTNALDSHRAAGIDRPIEVSTPTPLSPAFRVKDYGVGLSPEDIKSIYSMYGASTKRESNDFTGMLGLGSKSALTYTTQFTITAVKDGMKTVAAVSREPDGTGTMTIASCDPSSDHSGVEIVIPAAHTPDCKFLRAARHFFSFWDEGTYLLNGEKVPSVKEGLHEIAPNVWLESAMPTRYAYVVMGGVAYRLDPARYHNMNFSMVAFVEIGSVDFTPSREALHYTPRTISAVDAIIGQAEIGVSSYIQKKIDVCETHTEAMLILQTFDGLFQNDDVFRYKGTVVPLTLVIHDETLRINRHYLRRDQFSVTCREHLTRVSDTIGLKIGEGVQLGPASKSKIRNWLDQNQMEHIRRVILLRGERCITDVSPFLDAVPVFGWEDVKVARQPPPSTSGQRVQNITVIRRGTTGGIFTERVSSVEVEPGKRYVHSSTAEPGESAIVETLVKSFPDVIGVRLASNRFDKLSRLTGSIHVNIFVRAELDRILSQLTETDMIKLSHDDGLYSSNFNPYLGLLGAIDDPEIVKWGKALESEYSAEATLYRRLRGRLSNSQVIANPMNKYPLTSLVSSYSIPTTSIVEEMVFYMNAAYAARKGQNV